MSISTTGRRVAAGVLPDDVVRSETASGAFIYITLEDDVDAANLQTYLQQLTALIHDFEARADPPIATAVVGLGEPAFRRIAGSPPAHIATTLESAGDPVGADVVIYAMYTEGWAQADLEAGLARIGSGVVKRVVVHEGFQRPDGREPGGFRDGLRNAQTDRESVVFVDRDRQPEEPPAADGGSYLVTMRILQHQAPWSALSDAEQEQVIGRRKSDGSRIDLPEGTDAIAEPSDVGACPATSHVAKAGPRGELHDRTQIFRRGIPFSDLSDDGRHEHGLLFASFQASVEQFTTIWSEWMLNLDFPRQGVGKDSLVERGLIEPTSHGVFFVPPQDEYIGAPFFEPATGSDQCPGRIVVRKRLENPDGQPTQGERGGFVFQLFDNAGDPVGASFASDSTGRAVSPPVPVGESYVLRELEVNGPFEPAADRPVILDRRRLVIEVVNRATRPNPGYGG